MKILLADDHWIARAALKHLLKRLDRNVQTLEAERVDQAIEIAEKTPDLRLILLDLLMPGREAMDGLAAVRAACPDVPIVVMSMVEDRRAVLRTIDSGAQGYIPKTASASEILKALRQILQGEIYLPRSLLERGQQTGQPQSTDWQQTQSAALLRLQQLTDRQRDVLALLGQGLSNAAIADALKVSENTVRLHVSAILSRLGLSNRTQAALFSAQGRDFALPDDARRGSRRRGGAAPAQPQECES
jgi:DNA-binding NarL/FixJ family response regulator